MRNTEQIQKIFTVRSGPLSVRKCYEVSEDVILNFRSHLKSTGIHCFICKENGKYQLNLWEANMLIMLEAGIKEEHISMPGICTCCNPEFLFRIVHHMEKEEIWEHFFGIRRKYIYKIHYKKRELL